MKLETSREIDSNGRLQIPQLFLNRLNARPWERLDLRWDETTKEMIISFDPTPYLEERKKKDKEEELLKKGKESRITYTEWGFPIIETVEFFPKDFDTVAFLRESREERSDWINGLR